MSCPLILIQTYLYHVFCQNTTIWNVIIKFANTSGSLWHKCKCERCSVSHLTQFQAHSSSYVTWWFFFHCIKYFDVVEIIFWLNYELCMYLVWITLYWTSELMEIDGKRIFVSYQRHIKKQKLGKSWLGTRRWNIIITMKVCTYHTNEH